MKEAIKKYTNKGRVFLLIGIIVFIANNTYFGWNALPESYTESVMDGLVLACIFIWLRYSITADVLKEVLEATP